MGVTIYDIADRANVSIATVSRVFNNHARVSPKTRARVLKVAGELGYQPHASARSLARKETQLVSAVIPMMTNYFFVEVIRGLQERLAESELDLIVYSSLQLDDIDVQLDRALQRGLASGVLLFATPLTEARVDKLKRSGQPIILVDSFHPDFDCVSTHNEEGGCLATEHLIACGCKRIGMIMAHPESMPAADRRRGYEKALSEAGLPVEDDLVVISSDLDQHGYTEEAGYKAMRVLLERSPRPDGVFAASDLQALGALKAIQEAGLGAPGDVALIGFDDIKISQYVGLSTLRQPMYEMGRVAVEKLLTRMQQPTRPTSHTIFSPRLIRRASSIGSQAQPSVPKPLGA